jgi:hypothetical protein
VFPSWEISLSLSLAILEPDWDLYHSCSDKKVLG